MGGDGLAGRSRSGRRGTRHRARECQVRNMRARGCVGSDSLAGRYGARFEVSLHQRLARLERGLSSDPTEGCTECVRGGPPVYGVVYPDGTFELNGRRYTQAEWTAEQARPPTCGHPWKPDLGPRYILLPPLPG